MLKFQATVQALIVHDQILSLVSCSLRPAHIIHNFLRIRLIVKEEILTFFFCDECYVYRKEIPKADSAICIRSKIYYACKHSVRSCWTWKCKSQETNKLLITVAELSISLGARNTNSVLQSQELENTFYFNSPRYWNKCKLGGQTAILYL